jgi:hypothetical protein
MRRVILTSMFAPYTEPLRPGDEVWSINYGYQNQPNLARLYIMHEISYFFRTPERKVEFLRAVNQGHYRVILLDPCPEIPRSERFPIEDVLERLPFPYFTSGLPYVIAAAIREHVDVLRLHRIHVIPGAPEYLTQRDCLNFWLGLALGQGIRVELSEDSDLLRGAPWETSLYGYAPAPDGYKVQYAIGRAVRESFRPTQYELPPFARTLLATSHVPRYPVPPINLGTPPDVQTAPVVGAVPGERM